MGDPKRFWKESIGVTGPQPPHSTGGVAAAAAASSLSLERLLLALPAGTTAFPEAVAVRLWPAPTPTELKLLAAVAERLVRVPAGPVRDAIVDAVTVRRRWHRLTVVPAGHQPYEPSRLEARATELTRLARSAEEVGAALDAQHAARPDPALAAARDLLPDPRDLDADALIAAELGLLATSARGAGSAADLRGLGLSDAVDLFQALRTGKAAPEHDVFLQVFAATSLARRMGRAVPREELERCHRAMGRVAQGVERAVDASLATQVRDPRRQERLASWRRALLRAMQSVEAALAEPAAPEAAPVPPETAPGIENRDERCVALPPADPVTGPPLPAPSFAAPEPDRRGLGRFWRRWLAR